MQKKKKKIWQRLIWRGKKHCKKILFYDKYVSVVFFCSFFKTVLEGIEFALFSRSWKAIKKNIK